jgi:hypothetical protein
MYVFAYNYTYEASKQNSISGGNTHHWVDKNVLNLESQQNEFIGLYDNGQPTT